MGNTSLGWEKVFLGFAILAVISGIYLTVQKDYVIGISGSIVGIWLASQSINKIKNKKSE